MSKILKEKVKELRVKIDGLAQLTKELKPVEQCIVFDSRIGLDNNSYEIHKAYDSLILAKAWLGKVLGELGSKTPYPKDGTRKTVADIEPTAEVAKNLTIDRDGGWEEINHIQRVDYLRQEINEAIKQNASIWEIGIFDLMSGSFYDLIWKNLSEARFWLGFELQRIKDEQNKEAL